MAVVTKDVGTVVTAPATHLDVSIEPITDEQLDAYFSFRPAEKRDEVERRMASGHLCFAAWHSGRIIHAGWSATGRVHIPYIQSDILLGEKDFYIYDTFTLPEFRRSNLVVARSMVMHGYYGERGMTRSYGVIALMNRSGMAIVKPAGYREIGMYGSVRIGALHHTWSYPHPVEPLPPLAPHQG